MIFLKCKNCGWVHFGMNLKDILEELTKFRKYFNSLSKKDQKSYYGGKCSSIIDYIHCFKCSALYTQMRKAKNNEIPNGSTLQPILIEEKKNGKQRVCRTKRKAN